MIKDRCINRLGIRCPNRLGFFGCIRKGIRCFNRLAERRKNVPDFESRVRMQALKKKYKTCERTNEVKARENFLLERRKLTKIKTKSDDWWSEGNSESEDKYAWSTSKLKTTTFND